MCGRGADVLGSQVAKDTCWPEKRPRQLLQHLFARISTSLYIQWSRIKEYSYHQVCLWIADNRAIARRHFSKLTSVIKPLLTFCWVIQWAKKCDQNGAVPDSAPISGSPKHFPSSPSNPRGLWGGLVVARGSQPTRKRKPFASIRRRQVPILTSCQCLIRARRVITNCPGMNTKTAWYLAWWDLKRFKGARRRLWSSLSTSACRWVLIASLSYSFLFGFQVFNANLSSRFIFHVFR